MSRTQKPISIVVSDLHMGARDKYDDFVHQDGVFPAFVEQLMTSDDGRQGRIELLVNGDFLELAQVFPEAYRLGSADFWCSEAESLLKLEVILQSHADVFAATRRFVEAGNRCTFFAGNHDVELYWPKVQSRIRAAAGAVDFELGETWYSRYGGRLRISHGHMFDPANRFEDWSNPVRLGPCGILRFEMCPGTLFMVKFVNWMEHRYPFADNIHPNWRLAAVLWKEARGGLMAAAWVLLRFASRHSRDMLDGQTDPADVGRWVVAALQSNLEFRREVASLWSEVRGESVAATRIADVLDTSEAVESFMTDVIVRVSPDRWLPVFEDVQPQTLGVVDSGLFWKSKLDLRDRAREQWKKGAEVVTIGHTHEFDFEEDGGAKYYNTGSWTRSLPWSRDADLTLARLNDDSWFPYNLLYLRVEEQADGTLASEMTSLKASA